MASGLGQSVGLGVGGWARFVVKMIGDAMAAAQTQHSSTVSQRVKAVSVCESATESSSAHFLPLPSECARGHCEAPTLQSTSDRWPVPVVGHVPRE